MDGISAVTTVAAVIQTAYQVYTLCQTYYSTAKSARKDIQQLRQEVISLGDILTNISDLTKEDDSASLSCVRLLTQDGGPLQQCKELLEKLVTKLNPGEGKTSMRQFGVRALTWPFNSKDVEELLTKIGKQKATFNMALGADNVALSQAIKAGVTQLNNDLEEMRADQRRFNNDARWTDIYNWLSHPDPSSNHNTACSKHQPTTGAWFLDSEEFMKWKTSSNSFLWLHGISGCGKTILSSTIVEDVIEQWKSNPKIAVVYFYFDFHENDKRQCKSLVRSLIVQLSMQSMNAPESLDALFSRSSNGLRQPAANTLILTLQKILGAFEQVFIVVDALDECEDRAELLELVETISKWQLENLHILATSRRERDIEESLEPLVTDQISIESKVVNSDIRTYISERLQKDVKLRKWPANLKAEIEDTLMTKADGMFRWVVCQLDSLSKCLQPDKLRKALKSLPTDLYKTYDRIMDSIDDDYIEDVFKILQWLVYSTRPLDLAEVAEVVAVGLDNETGFDPENRLRESLDVLTICSSLVTTVARGNSEYDGHIYQEPEVRLAHFSVKEYLVNARIQREDTIYTIEKDDQGILAQTCLTYLLYFREPEMLNPSYVDDFPLAEYAANYWFVHARAAKKDIGKINKLGFRLCQSYGTYLNWIRLRNLDGYGLGDHELCNRDVGTWGDPREPASPPLYHTPLKPPLYYAALAGLVDLSKFFLENGADVNAEGGQYSYALQAASIVPYPSVVRLLLDHGAAINAKGGRHVTALHAACYEGHEATVRLLLDHGADVSIQNEYGETALQVACSQKQEAVIKVMYEIRPDLMCQRLAHQLREAALIGHLAIATKLLEDGAKTDVEGGTYSGALQAASYNGHKLVVELLLSNGANVNIKGGEYGSPLQAASYKGHESVVKVLLENGADVNFRGGKHNTALQAASYSGHQPTVKLLLEKGADVNPDGSGPGCEGCDNPLQAASFRGHVAVVKLLLENGANVNVQGGECNSALQAASLEGHVATVEFLLENGADLNVYGSGGRYPSALAAAAFGGHEIVVRLFIQRGINTSYYSEALLWATTAPSVVVDSRDRNELGWRAVIKLLHEQGTGFTAEAFKKACEGASLGMIELMLQEGFDFVPDANYYRGVLEEIDIKEQNVNKYGGPDEVARRGFKLVKHLLRERIGDQAA